MPATGTEITAATISSKYQANMPLNFKMTIKMPWDRRKGKGKGKADAAAVAGPAPVRRTSDPEHPQAQFPHPFFFDFDDRVTRRDQRMAEMGLSGYSFGPAFMAPPAPGTDLATDSSSTVGDEIAAGDHVGTSVPVPAPVTLPLAPQIPSSTKKGFFISLFKKDKAKATKVSGSDPLAAAVECGKYYLLTSDISGHGC
jgi:hypothetical protein